MQIGSITLKAFQIGNCIKHQVYNMEHHPLIMIR